MIKKDPNTTSKDKKSGINIPDRESLALFLDVPLKRLSYLLYVKDRKTYYQELTVPKRTGGNRTIHAVREPLRWLQRTALEKLEAEFKPSFYAHGFTKKHSILTNASYHQRKKLIIKFDIKDFFPTINFGRVLGLFKGAPFHFGHTAALTLAHISCIEGKTSFLPQGGAMSPYVANMLCRRMDKRMSELASEHKCSFTRYADDLTFSTNDVNKFSPEKFIDLVYKIILEEGFEPNILKTKIMTKRDRQVVTGIIVNDGYNVNREYVRGLRSILRNCKKNGIASQIVREKPFKEPRSSRPSITKGILGGFVLNGIELDTQSAESIFLEHLLGRINFVGNVVQCGEQPNQSDRFRRVLFHQDLLKKFYELVRGNSNYSPLQKKVLKQIKFYPTLWAEVGWEEKRRNIREDHHRLFLSKPETKALLNRFEVVKDDTEKSTIFLSEISALDPRFFGKKIVTNYITADKIKGMLTYPAFDADITMSIFESLRDSTGLGVLVHNPLDDEFNGDRAYNVISEVLDPVFYYLPFGLRNSIDIYINSLNALIREIGPQARFDVLREPRIAADTKRLKQETRFGKLNEECSILTDVLADAFKTASSKSGIVIREPEYSVVKTSFYTHVPSVSRALLNIFISMLKHHEGRTLKVVGSPKIYPGRYVLRVLDEGSGIIDEEPGRNFAHGKISSVVDALNGFCDYFVYASFIDGKHYAINMMTG